MEYKKSALKEKSVFFRKADMCEVGRVNFRKGECILFEKKV